MDYEVYLTHTQGHYKFWRGRRTGSVVVCEWGRIGTDGQSKTFSFSTPSKAASFLFGKEAEKRGKGYVGSASVAAPSAAPQAVQRATPVPQRAAAPSPHVPIADPFGGGERMIRLRK